MVNYQQRMDELMAEYNRLMACQYLSNPNIKEIIKLKEIPTAKSNPETGDHSIQKICRGYIHIPGYNIEAKDRYKKGLKLVLNFQGRTLQEIETLLNNNDQTLIRAIKRKIKEHSEKYFQCYSSEIY